MMKSLARLSTRFFFKKTKHSPKNLPYTEVVEAISREEATALVAGFGRVKSDTKRMLKKDLSQNDVAAWLGPYGFKFPVVGVKFYGAQGEVVVLCVAAFLFSVFCVCHVVHAAVVSVCFCLGHPVNVVLFVPISVSVSVSVILSLSFCLSVLSLSLSLFLRNCCLWCSRQVWWCTAFRACPVLP